MANSIRKITTETWTFILPLTYQLASPLKLLSFLVHHCEKVISFMNARNSNPFISIPPSTSLREGNNIYECKRIDNHPISIPHFPEHSLHSALLTNPQCTARVPLSYPRTRRRNRKTPLWTSILTFLDVLASSLLTLFGNSSLFIRDRLLIRELFLPSAAMQL